MKVASIFIYNPCVSWLPKDRSEYSRDYWSLDDFRDEFLAKEKMKLVRMEVECLCGVNVVHLEMKSEYSITHPDSNQSSYLAEVVMYAER